MEELSPKHNFLSLDEQALFDFLVNRYYQKDLELVKALGALNQPLTCYVYYALKDKQAEIYLDSLVSKLHSYGIHLKRWNDFEHDTEFVKAFNQNADKAMVVVNQNFIDNQDELIKDIWSNRANFTLLLQQKSLEDSLHLAIKGIMSIDGTSASMYKNVWNIVWYFNLKNNEFDKAKRQCSHNKKIKELKKLLHRKVNPSLLQELIKKFKEAKEIASQNKQEQLTNEIVELINATQDLVESNNFISYFGKKYDGFGEKSNLLQLLNVKLRANYRRTEYVKVQLIEPDTEENNNQVRGVTLDDIFVNLVIVKEEQQSRWEKERLKKSRWQPVHNNNNQDNKSSEAEKEILDVLQAYEDIYKVKEPIELIDLFKETKTKSVEREPKEELLRRLLLLGRAGIGKSTLCRYLAYQWSKGKLLQEFTWVFHIELKKLVKLIPKEKIINKSIQSLLYHYFGAYLDYSEQDINEICQSRSGVTLFLIDGYDEVAHLEHPLVEETLLSREYYLLTSRPYAAQPKRESVNRVLENVGLMPENVKAYIDKYFKHRYPNQEASESLKAWLNNQERIRTLCTIPLYVELVCIIWGSDSQDLQAQADLTFVDFYSKLIDKLMRRFIARYQQPRNISSEHPEIIVATTFLSHLAFTGMKTGHLLIAGEFFLHSYNAMQTEILNLSQEKDRCSLLLIAEMSQARFSELRNQVQKIVKEGHESELNRNLPILLERLLEAGFLKPLGASEEIKNNSYYFLHFSMQELFTAWYLSEHLEEEKGFVASHKYDPAWQLTWTMVACLLKNDSKRLNLFFELILAKPRDILGEYELILLAQCLEACNGGMKLDFKSRQKIIKHLQVCMGSYLEGGALSESILNELLQLPQLVKCANFVEMLLTASRNKHGEVRERAFKILLYLPIDKGKLIDLLLTGSKDPYPVVRACALYGLCKLDEPDGKVIETLIIGCKDPDSSVRSQAFYGLSYLVRFNDAVIEAIIPFCADAKKQVRIDAFKALGKVPLPNNKIINALINGTNDSSRRVGQAAYAILGNIISANPSIGVDLLSRKDVSESIRVSAIEDLSRSKGDDELVIQALLAALNNPERKMRREVLKWLTPSFITHGQIAEAVFAACRDTSAEIRKLAFQNLKAMPAFNQQILDVLLVGCQDHELSVSEEAWYTLAFFPVLNDSVSKALFAACEDPEIKIRISVFRGLFASKVNKRIIEALLIKYQEREELEERKTVELLEARETFEEQKYVELLKAIDELHELNKKIIEAVIFCADYNKDAALQFLARMFSLDLRAVVITVLACSQKNIYWKYTSFLSSLSDNLDSLAIDSKIVKFLLSARYNANAKIRQVTLKTLSYLPVPNEMKSKALFNGCQDIVWQVRYACIQELERLFQVIDDVNIKHSIIEIFFICCNDDEKDIRKSALNFFRTIPESYVDDKVVEAVLAGCVDRKRPVREEALWALRDLPIPKDRKIETLFISCKDHKKTIRWLALRILSSFPQPDERIIQALLTGCYDSKDYVQDGALHELEQLSLPTESGMKVLLNWHKISERKIREAILSLLGRLAQTDESLAAFLAKKSESLWELELKSLCQFYPSWLQQSVVRSVLSRRLGFVRASEATGLLPTIMQVASDRYRLYIGKQHISVTCANPKQFKKDLLSFRSLPKLELKQDNSHISFKFFDKQEKKMDDPVDNPVSKPGSSNKGR